MSMTIGTLSGLGIELHGLYRKEWHMQRACRSELLQWLRLKLSKLDFIVIKCKGVRMFTCQSTYAVSSK
jgi:hypothetical protein